MSGFAPVRVWSWAGGSCSPVAPRSRSSAVDAGYFVALGPLQGALSKGVSWSQIKMSFSWRSASFKERRIYWSGCWLPATRLLLRIPLSALGFFPSFLILTCLPLSPEHNGWVSPTLQSPCFLSSALRYCCPKQRGRGRVRRAEGAAPPCTAAPLGVRVLFPRSPQHRPCERACPALPAGPAVSDFIGAALFGARGEEAQPVPRSAPGAAGRPGLAEFGRVPERLGGRAPGVGWGGVVLQAGCNGALKSGSVTELHV